MKTIYSVLAILIFSFVSAIAADISGTIINEEKEAVIGATVRLLDKNEKLLTGVISGTKGKFNLQSVKNGQYKIEISFIGFETIFKEIEVKNNKNIDLGKLELKITEIQGEEVVVEAYSTTGELIKDTSQFNAKAFKTAENAVAEDLLKKIPGVEVTSDGTVKAQGENVKKVLVDGKQFFSDDPKVAMKNIPANMIDKVQIYDKNSDNSEFTGREDDEKEKAINFITKPSRRKGVFGKISAGYGNDSRYNTTLSMNFMNDQQRLTLLGMSNNVSIQNFSFSDIMGAGNFSGRGMRFFGGMGGGGINTTPNIGSSAVRPSRLRGPSSMMVSANDGISTNHSAGLNYSDSYSDWGQVYASYFFNTSDNNNVQDITRNFYAIGDSSYKFNQDGKGDSKGYNHKLNGNMQIMFDSTHSLMIYPYLAYQTNEMTSSSSTISQYDFDGSKINESNNNYFTNGDGIDFANYLTYVYKFKNKRRTFNISLDNNYNKNNGYSIQDAKTTYYLANQIDTINQKINSNSKSYSYGVEVEYIEPITDSATMRAFYEYSTQNSDNNSEALAFDLNNNDYTIIDPVYSSKLNSTFQVQTFGINYRLKSGILDLGATLRYRMSELNTELILPKVSHINYKMNNLLPSLRLRLNFDKTKSFRLGYYSFYNAPNTSQLSEVLDVSNPLQLYYGNSNLKPVLAHNMHINFMNMSDDFQNYFSVFGFLTFRENYISNTYLTAMQDTTIENVLLPAGSQLLTPMNMSGYFDSRLGINYSFPLNFMKLKVNLGASGNYNTTPSIINNIKNNSQNYGYRLNFGLNSNISENIDYNISTAYDYNFTQNNISTAQDYTYKALSLNFDLNWTIWSGIFIRANSNNVFYIQNAMNDNRNINLLNLSLGWKFLTNNAAELELKAFDVFDQNANIGNNITDRYTEIVSNNILRRYFLLTFTYNLRAFGM